MTLIATDTKPAGLLEELKAIAFAPENAERTWQALQRHAILNGHPAGLARPDDFYRLVLYDGHPFKDRGDLLGGHRGNSFRCSSDEVDEKVNERNRWFSTRLNTEIVVYSYEEDGKTKYKAVHLPKFADGYFRLRMMLDTLLASINLDYDAEVVAMKTLATKITERQYKRYVVTGTLMETSKRSGVSYLFRRQRPTIALRLTPNKLGGESHHFLAALCLHPLGYYEGTWSGAMVPTDDVLAHLMLMRGDEKMFWKRANHHDIHSRNNGL